MNRPVISVIREVLSLSGRILDLASECEALAEDDACLRLGAELRDLGYRLRGKVVCERHALLAAGLWDEGVAGGEQDKGVRPVGTPRD